MNQNLHFDKLSRRLTCIIYSRLQSVGNSGSQPWQHAGTIWEALRTKVGSAWRDSDVMDGGGGGGGDREWRLRLFLKLCK